MGKVLLASLPSGVRQRVVRRIGLAAGPTGRLHPRSLDSANLMRSPPEDSPVEEDEREVGIYSLAAPVRDHTGAVVAALALTAPSFRAASTTHQGRASC